MPTFTAGRYAAVTSTLALLVALGGTSYAVTQVGTNQIRNGAVTTPKIARNAVEGTRVRDRSLTGADVRDGGLRGADVRNGSLTGDDIDEGSLGTVGTARSIEGIGIKQVFFDAGPSTTTVVFNRGGLKLTAVCTPENSLDIIATTTIGDGAIYSVIQGDQTPPAADPIESDLEDESFDVGDEFDLLAGTPGNIAQITFDYFGGNKLAISGHLVTDLQLGYCRANGFVIVGE